MGIIFDSAIGAEGYPLNGFSATHSLGQSSGNGRMVIVFLGLVGGTTHTVSEFTYNGVSLHLIHTETTIEYYGRILSGRFGYLLDSELPASSGSYSVHAHTTGVNGPYDGMIGVVSFYNAEQEAPTSHVAQSNFSNPPFSSSTPVSTDIVVSSGEGTLIDGLCLDSSYYHPYLHLEPGTNQTERVEQVRTNSIIGLTTETYNTSGTKTMSQSTNYTYHAYAHIVLELEPSQEAETKYNAPIMGMNF